MIEEKKLGKYNKEPAKFRTVRKELLAIRLPNQVDEDTEGIIFSTTDKSDFHLTAETETSNTAMIDLLEKIYLLEYDLWHKPIYGDYNCTN